MWRRVHTEHILLADTIALYVQLAGELASCMEESIANAVLKKGGRWPIWCDDGLLKAAA